VARPLNYFLCGCVKSRVHDKGRPKTGQQLGQYVIEVAAGIRNEMERIQREPSIALSMQLQGGHVKILFICMF